MDPFRARLVSWETNPLLVYDVCRFTLPPHLTLKNFEGLNLGTLDRVSADNFQTKAMNFSSSPSPCLFHLLTLFGQHRRMTLAWHRMSPVK